MLPLRGRPVAGPEAHWVRAEGEVGLLEDSFRFGLLARTKHEQRHLLKFRKA